MDIDTSSARRSESTSGTPGEIDSITWAVPDGGAAACLAGGPDTSVPGARHTGDAIGRASLPNPRAQVRAGRDDSSREQRFNDLVGVHMDDLYRFAYWLSGNRSVAEDLVQETMLRAWKSIDRLRDTKAAKNWLLTIVRRENARHFGRRQLPASETPTEEVAAERSDYDTSTEAFTLRRALSRLPPEYLEPLLMQILYGYSQQEIAEQLGISCAGAGTRLFRARRKMRALL